MIKQASSRLFVIAGVPAAGLVVMPQSTICSATLAPVATPI
jgi:hypothetical protein